MDQVEAIERATFAAVPPRRLEQWQDWLLGLDEGTVGRCHSAVPLRHAPPPADALEQLEQRYRAAGLPLVLRLPETGSFTAMQRQLRERGFQRTKPTLVQVGAVATLTAAGRNAHDILITTSPGPDWEDVFLGEGFDPVDGASRLAILRRGTDSAYASLRVDGRTVAVGSACFSHGWCGIHGMRALPAYRGRGLASAVLGALAQAAHARGVRHCFLQVDAGNAPACALYARHGFTTAWRYAYFKA